MTGRYKPYSEYKDSGVEWLGKVPKCWTIKKLKYICSVGTGTKDTANAVEDGVYPFFVRSQTIERINSLGADCEAVLTAGDGVGVGKVFHYYNGKFDYHQRVYMLNNFNLVTGKFVYYYLSNNFYKVALEGNAKSTVDSLRMPQFLNFELSLPEQQLQNKIVLFLDHETAKIDIMIEKQQQLIQLLKEKRQAVINRAVTKGLNPNAKMRDSGVEWLGEVPEHWKVSPLKWYAGIKSGENLPAGDIESTQDEDFCYPVYGGNGILGYSKRFNLINAAIIIGRVGALCGNVHKVMDLSWISDNALILSINTSVFSLDYISLCLGARDLNTLADKNAQPLITGTKVTNEYIPIPPVDEQREIEGRVIGMMEQFEMLSSQAETGITLLKERRTALISAAVTGKIDVRNWVSPQGSQTNKEVAA